MTAAIGADVPNDRPIDGANVLPMLQGQDWQRAKPIPFASRLRKDSPPAAIIHKGYKLLMWLDENREDELYHLQEDPREQTNLVQEKQEIANLLRTTYLDWLNSARHSYQQGDYPNYQPQGRFIEPRSSYENP